MLVEGRVVGRHPDTAVVLFEVAEPVELLRLGVPDPETYDKLLPGLSFYLEIEDGMVVSCKRAPKAGGSGAGTTRG